MTVYLKDIYLGCADGDSESNKDNFKNLFYTGNNKYDEITQNAMKFIIAGQKGTGKTILGRYIEETYKEKGIECKIFNKNHITLAKLIELKNDVLSNDEAVHFFKWMIYFEIYKMLKDIKLNTRFRFNKSWFNERKAIKEYRVAIEELTSIYEERYPKGNFEFIEYMTSDEETVHGEIAATSQKNIVKPKISGTKKNSKNKNNRRKEFYKVLAQVEKLILTCLKHKSVVLILDDLDELEIKINDSLTPLTSIKKLIDSFKEINTLFVKSKVDPSKCIILLRSDILKKLNKTSTNLNKVLSDNTVELYWINKEEQFPEKHVLMEMILNKIKSSSEEYAQLDNRTLYYTIFPNTINGESVTKYLIDNSFGRPRDVIFYLDIMAKRYPNETSFKEYMFRECKQAYSERFMDELYNEMNIHIEIEIIDEYFKLIRLLGYKSFQYSHLYKCFKENKREFKYIKDLSQVLDKLYTFGVIGNSWKVNEGTTAEKTKFSWGYRKDGNPSINQKQRFSVHYGLRSALNTN